MHDDFGLYPREEPFDPFSVMLFKALQVIAFLFFIALLAIAPEAKDGKIARLREAIDVVVAAEAIYPNGLADVLAKRS